MSEEQGKEQELVKMFKEVRALHQVTFGIHDPENELVIAAGDHLKKCFARIAEIGVPSDQLPSAIGWLEKMERSNQNGRIRETLATGMAQLRR